MEIPIQRRVRNINVPKSNDAKAGKRSQAKKAKQSKSNSIHWEFCVKSYVVNAEFSPLSLPAYQPSLTVIGLSSESAGPTGGQPNAVVYFYWPGRKLPLKPSSVTNNTLLLYYPIGAFGGILQLLQGPQEVYCYYDDDHADPLGPRAGLKQKNFNVR